MITVPKKMSLEDHRVELLFHKETASNEKEN